MKVRDTIGGISNTLNRFCLRAAMGFLTAMLLLILFQILARYIFRAAPVWTAEAARYCMVWGGLLGATVAYKADQDPRLFQPPQTGPRWWVLLAGWLRALATVVFLGPVIYFSDRFLIRTWHRTSDALEIQLFWVTLAVPVAVIVILIHLLSKLIGADDRHAKNGT